MLAYVQDVSKKDIWLNARAIESIIQRNDGCCDVRVGKLQYTIPGTGSQLAAHFNAIECGEY